MVILQLVNPTAGIANPAPKDLTLAPADARAKPLSADPAAPHLNFHELLSELNPLQYLPVVGTLFRALTGDTIPQPALEAGSMVVSGLIAGPIGVALNLGELAAEKVTGIDPERLMDKMLASIGIGHVVPVAVATPVNHPAEAQSKDATAAQSAIAWSPAELAAEGIKTNATGDFVRGGQEGSEVLNSLELARIQARHVAVQYASNAANS